MRCGSSSFLRDRQGTGAVEFALVAPFLLLVYFGCVEVTASLSIARKAQLATGAVNDLVTRSSTLSADDIAKIFTLATAAIQPFDAKPLKIRTGQIFVDAKGTARVDWSCGDLGTGKPKKDDPVDLPSSLRGLRSTYIQKTELRYDYVPLGRMAYTTTIDLGGVAYANPRYADRILSPGC